MTKPNEVTLEEALSIAKKHHQANNLTLADRTYRDILKIFPQEPTSLHYLAIIAYQRGNIEESLSLIEQAAAANKESAEVWNIYGVVLARLNKKEEALEKWEQALALKPDYHEVYSNIGNALWELGRDKESQKACEKAVEIKPDFADGYINLGIALMSQGKDAEAIEMWQKSLEINPHQYNAYVNIGNSMREIGKIKESEEYCRKALKIFPDSPEGLLNLANALRDQGQFEEAEQAYKKAIAVRPDYVDAHNNLAILMNDMKRYDETITSARFALAFNPTLSQAHSNLSIALRETGRLNEAEASARKALHFLPDSVEAQLDLAEILFVSDRYEEAETLFTDALEKLPNSARLYLKLSNVMERTNRLNEALEAVNKAIEITPDMPEAYHRLASVHFMGNNIEAALTALDKALEIYPNFPSALATRSEILQAHGDMEGALEATRAGMALDDSLPFLHFTLSKLKKFKDFDDPDFVRMREVEKIAPNFGRPQECAINFALHKAYEDIKDFDKSFEHLQKGNDIKRSIVNFDTASQRNSYAKHKEVYSKEFLNTFKGVGHEDAAPIFIVGMPRSGTTLTEQIISSHPDVFGAGELHYISELEHEFGRVTPENAKAMGERYMERIRNIEPDAATAKMLTDKMPGNYMRVGKILSILPNAKIIHTNRNPVDTCLSCYKQFFARAHYWSYNLEEMAEHYHLYMDMMEHWRKIIPGSFLEIHYEETVNDFENQARRLIDFVGLEWNDACLTPHKTKRSIMTASKGQVRQPIYKTSVEGWRRYEKQLTPLAEALAEYMPKQKA